MEDELRALRALLDAQNKRLYEAARERDRLIAENRRLRGCSK